MAEIDDIFLTMKDLDRRLRSLETTPQPPNINSVTSSLASFTLSAGSAQWFDVEISNTENRRLLAIPSIVVYKDSVSAANRYPDGGNWTGANLGTFQFFPYLDPSLSDGNNEQLRVFFINFDINPINIVFQVNFRYLLKQASA